MKTALLVALLALTSTTAFADERPTLTLSGTGTVTVEPDEGYITVGVSIVKPTSAEALAENSATMQKLHDSLATLNIVKKNIQTVDFSVGEHYTTVETDKVDRNGNPITKTVKDGFEVSNIIRVTVCDLPSFGKVLDAVVQEGANRVHGISFGSSKATEKLDEARALAAKDALRKAKILTDGLYVSLGHVMSVSEDRGGRVMHMQYEAARSADAPGGEAPVSGGSLTFSVTVHVQWELAHSLDEKNSFKIELK